MSTHEIRRVAKPGDLRYTLSAPCMVIIAFLKAHIKRSTDIFLGDCGRSNFNIAGMTSIDLSDLVVLVYHID